MKTPWIGVAAALVVAAPAHAALPAGNLIANPDAEAGAAPASGCSGTPTRPRWTAEQRGLGAGSCSYGGADPTSNPAAPGGPYFFVGDAPSVLVSQVVDISGAAPEIDAGKAQANLAADLGGFG